MRQTSLSLRELEAELETPTGLYPQCLVVNEIGEIMMAGGEEAARAEEIIGGLLDGANQDKQCIALCFLSDNAANLSPETIRKIGQFRNDPAHQEIIEAAEGLIRNL